MDLEQKPGRYNVCSWTGTYVDVVATFPADAEPTPDGAISLPWLQTEVPDCDLYGPQALKREIQRTAVMVRGAELSDRQVRNIRGNFPYARFVCGLQCTAVNTLS